MGYKDNKKWRLKHPEERNKQRKRYYKQFQNAKNSRKRWSPEDIDEVLFSHPCDRDLSHEIGRSVQAIQVKRSKLWKVGGL